MCVCLCPQGFVRTWLLTLSGCFLALFYLQSNLVEQTGLEILSFWGEIPKLPRKKLYYLSIPNMEWSHVSCVIYSISIQYSQVLAQGSSPEDRKAFFKELFKKEIWIYMGYLISIYIVLTISQKPLQELYEDDFISTTTLWVKCHFYPQFTDEESEALMD